jgi:hypothetical protein
MSDKLNAALVAVEKARVAALEAAIADRSYRACIVLDENGMIQRGVNRARKLTTPKTKKASK